MEKIYKPKIKNVASSVWVPEPLYHWAVKHAKQNKVSVAEVFRVALAEFQARIVGRAEVK